MNWKFLFLFILPLLSLTSCIEIIDDLTINSDGTGNFKYTINLSASKIKINSLLALDSIDGKKVPSIEEIKQKINHFKGKLEEKEGISNLSIETNFTDYIFKLKCDFTSLNALQDAIHQVIEEEHLNKSGHDLTEKWLVWDGQKLTRNIPDYSINRTRNLSDTEIEQLKSGKYTSVTRFDRPVEKFQNTNAKLSPSKMAIMLQTNAYALSQNINLLENVIYLTPVKKE